MRLAATKTSAGGIVRPRIQLLMADSEYLVVSAGRIPSSCSLSASRVPLPATRRLFDDLSDRHRKLGRRIRGTGDGVVLDRTGCHRLSV